MKKDILAVGIIALLLTIASSGCIENKKELSAEQIMSNFSNAVNSSVNSYKYTTNGLATITVVDNSGTNITEMLSFSNGTIDITNQNLKLETDYITSGKNKTEQWIVYILDFFVYTGTGEKGNLTWKTEHTSAWEKNGSYVFWDTYSILEGLSKGMLNQQTNTTFKRLDDETLNGETYYVIQSISGYSYYELQMKFWINKDDYLLYKIQSTTTTNQTATQENKATMTTVEGQFLFYDYNKPVTIELPPNVEKANDTYLEVFVENDGRVKIQNRGGVSLANYRIKADYWNGTEIGNQTYNDTKNPWKVREYRYVFPDKLVLKVGEGVWVSIYKILNNGSEEEIYNIPGGNYIQRTE